MIIFLRDGNMSWLIPNYFLLNAPFVNFCHRNLEQVPCEQNTWIFWTFCWQQETLRDED